MSPKSGSFICGCVFPNRCPSVAPPRTQAGLIVGQGKQTPEVRASGRWVCTADCRTRSSNGSTSVKPTTLKPATALKEHTCASTRISGDAVILVVNVFQLTTWSLPHSAKGRVVLALADVSFFSWMYFSLRRVASGALQRPAVWRRLPSPPG